MASRIAIPPSVKKILRDEVGFGCPVTGCGNPYLEYHHFDPPIHVEPHNNPDGMIALCAHHHRKADGGLYTKEQLRALKENKTNRDLVRGNLDWMRNDLLAVAGSNLFYNTPIPIQIDGHNVIKFEKDVEGYYRLSVNLLSISEEERVVIRDNEWENIGRPVDLRSPPQGKELEVAYRNGDYIYLRLHEIESNDVLVEKFRFSCNGIDEIQFPITLVEINLDFGDTDISINTDCTSLGSIDIRQCMVIGCRIGLSLNPQLPWKHNPIYSAQRRIISESDNVISVDFGAQ